MFHTTILSGPRYLPFLTFVLIGTLSFGQSVQRITDTDVLEAVAHPQCTNGSLQADPSAMPQNSAHDLKVAAQMRSLRAYRDNGQHSPNMMIHINNDQIKSDARIREVTPDHFQIETFGSGNHSYCFQYDQIVNLRYDEKGNLHLYVQQ